MSRSEHFERLAAADEVVIETRRGGRKHRTIIWVVEVDGSLYVRSYLGEEGCWYRRALADPHVALSVEDLREEFRAAPAADEKTNDLVTAAFKKKYHRSKSLGFMVVPPVLPTTLRLDAA